MDPTLLERAERFRRQQSANGHHPRGDVLFDGARWLSVSAPLPAYPTDAFPPPVARFIREAAASLRAPEGMVALPLLACAAATIGNRRTLAVKRGWRERAILWAAVVAPPGSAKTPALDAARGPLTALQQTAKAVWDQRRSAYERDLADWQAIPKGERDGVAKPTPPRLEHFLTTDSTKEALAVMAAESAGVAVYRDELTAWVSGFDAYRSGRGGDRQDMLSLWSGTPLKIDRKSGDPILAERPTVSVVGGVQPDRLRLLAPEAGQDGFLDRFLWVYEDVPPLRWADTEVSEATERAMHECIAKLRVEGPAALVRLSPDALAAFKTWYDQNADQQAAVEALLRGVYAKLPAQCLRLSLVLHCLTYPDAADDELSGETMEGALALTETHRAHAVEVMAHFQEWEGARETALRERIFRIIRKYESGYVENWVPRSVIYNGLRNVASRSLATALDTLADDGAVERRIRPTATKPVEEYRFVLSDNSENLDGEEGWS